MTDTLRPLLEVAEALRIYKSHLPRGLASKAGFYQAIARKDIPTIRMGRRIYVIRAKLEHLLYCETPPSAPEGGESQ